MSRRRLAALAVAIFLATSCAAQEPVTAPGIATDRERAFVAERAERFGEAADAFLRLVTAEPSRAEWVLAASRCLGRAARYREALELLDRARGAFPTSLEIPTMLARTLLLQAEAPGTLHPEILWADAAEIAEDVLKKSPDDAECRLLLAQVRFLQGDLEAATEAATEAVRRFPDRSGAHVLVGQIATSRFRLLLRRHADERPDGQAEADLIAAIDDERQTARRAFVRAAELDPSRAYPHAALGQLDLLDRKLGDARAHFLDAISIDPDSPIDHGVFSLEGDWQSRRDLYAEALRRYSASANPIPRKRATLRWYEGRAFYDGGEWAAAAGCFSDAATWNPAAPNSWYYLAMCAWRLGDQDAAEEHAAKYARFGAPAFADVIRALDGSKRAEVGAVVQFLADRAYQKGRIPNSRDLNHVVACLADSADAWNNHAFLCRETGRFEDALTSYEYAQQREPDSPQLMNDTGVVLQYHLANPDNLARARTLYERAIEIADRQIADAALAAPVRQRAEKARSDAKANLAAMN